jgi:hypothetical protein
MKMQEKLIAQIHAAEVLINPGGADILIHWHTGSNRYYGYRQ